MYENRIIKPVKNCVKKDGGIGKSNGRVNFIKVHYMQI
jgi:hypothetical protein